MIKYSKFVNESKKTSMWYVTNGDIDTIDINDCLCKIVDDFVIQFSLPYKPNFFINNGTPRCLYYNNMVIKRFKRIPIINFDGSVDNATDRLKSIIDVELFSGEKIDYLDVTNNIDTISFLPENKIKYLSKNIDPYNNKYRQEMKIGRFFRKYTILDINEIKLSVVEKLVNIYKSVNDGRINNTEMEIVEGEDIKYWYDGNNYYGENGILNKSCMKDEDPDIFNIYADNPDVCKMVIKRHNKHKNKIIGRALLWKTNKGIMMDRIYTYRDHDVYSFIGFANKNNWLLRDNIGNMELIVQLKDKDYGEDSENPYLDTMKYYVKNKNQLTNKRPKGTNYYILNYF